MSHNLKPREADATLLDTPHADLWLRIAAVAVEVEGLKRDLGSPDLQDCRRRLAEASADKRRRALSSRSRA